MYLDETTTPLERAHLYAALSGHFNPDALLDALGEMDAAETMDVTVDLASVCDTSESTGWLLRGTVRRDRLATLHTPDALTSAIEWRRQYSADAATSDLLDALSGTGAYSVSAIELALEQAPERETLARIAVALERAGTPAPAYDTLASVRSALGRVDVDTRGEAPIDRGFLGRRDEIERTVQWLFHPHTNRPVTSLFITGAPGVGKSAFIDEVVRRVRTAQEPWIVVKLDFDRGGLDVQDRIGLTMEISRQVSRELGADAAHIRAARLLAAGAGVSTGPNVKGAGRDRIPDELSVALGEAVLATGRRVLLILDTIEVLRGRGETHPLRLFETLDELCERGLRPVAVIAAGRSTALDTVPDRVGDRIVLDGLDDESADRLLDRFDVTPSLYPRIREVSRGNPSVLRLGADAIHQSGTAALDRSSGRRQLAAAYLQRFLLSRIGDDRWRRLAQPGLLVRRVNADLILEVLVPQAGLGRFHARDAAVAFDALTTQHWLVEPDSVPGWVRHRPDVRKTLLENIYDAEKPTTAGRLNRAAARWFETRTEPFAALEAAYHHLQAMRAGGSPPDLPRDILDQFDDETLAELPSVAQDAVRTARGDLKSSPGAGSAATGLLDVNSAAVELELTIERGDIREAEYLYDRSFGSHEPGAPSRSRVDPASPAADVVRAFLWRAGRWSEALNEFDPRRSFSGSFGERSQVVTLALLEMWAESGFAQLTRAFATRPGLTELATELRARGVGGSLANGALGFALLSAGAGQRGSWSATDPVDAAATLWAPTTTWQPGAPASAVLDALAIPGGRFAAHVSAAGVATASGPSDATGSTPAPTPRPPDMSTAAGAARVLASATPYVFVVEAYRNLHRGTALVDHLSRMDHALAAAGGIPPGGAGGWSIASALSPDGSTQNIATLGLLAEALEASAFLLRDPDLRLIARSAELWRRTCAGDWAYPSRRTEPLSWSRRPDASIHDRVTQLTSRQECLEQIRLWTGVDSDRQAMAQFTRLRRRYPAADRAARHSSAQDAASALLARSVPSALVPAMAKLYSIEGERSS